MEIIFIFKHALMISFFVFGMMLLVNFIDMASKGRISDIMKVKSQTGYAEDVSWSIKVQAW